MELLITNGRRRHNYAVSFRKSAKAMYMDAASTEEKVAESHRMVEDYYDSMGEYPDSHTLELLADAILSEELRERYAYKSRKYEYPVVATTRQTSWHKRWSAEYPIISPAYDYLLAGEIPGKVYADAIDSIQKAYKVLSWGVVDAEIRQLTAKFRDENAKWAQAVKKRDGYRCQNPNCATRSGIMHAHHIKNYADFPHLRTELSNGVTLCERCHVDFHIGYGKHRNNDEQLADFFREVS